MSSVRKIDVLITSFARPELLKKLLVSLKSQEINKDPSFEVKYLLFQDSVIDRSGEALADPDLARQNVQAFHEMLPNGSVILEDFNLGIVGNLEREFNHMRQSDADSFFLLEEDLVLSPYYVSTIDRLIQQASSNPLIGMITGTGAEPPRDLATQKNNRRAIIPMGHKWSIAFSRFVFQKIDPFLQKYFEACKDTNYKCTGRDDFMPDRVEGAREFFKGFGWPVQTHPPFSPDQAINLFSYIYPMYNISTFICLGKYVGEHGSHSNTEIFQQMQLDKLELFDERPPEEFDLPSIDQTFEVIAQSRSGIFNARVHEEKSNLVERKSIRVDRDGKKVNLGCGSNIKYGWINIDRNINTEFGNNGTLVLSHDFLNGLPFADESVDTIYACHLFQKHNTDVGFSIIKECFRVLKPGGVLRVSVPDTGAMIRAYYESNDAYFDKLKSKFPEFLPNDLIMAPIDFITRNAMGWNHENIYDSTKMVKMLTGAGFGTVRETEHDLQIDPGDERMAFAFFVEGSRPRA